MALLRRLDAVVAAVSIVAFDRDLAPAEGKPQSSSESATTDHVHPTQSSTL